MEIYEIQNIKRGIYVLTIRSQCWSTARLSVSLVPAQDSGVKIAILNGEAIIVMQIAITALEEMMD